MTNKREIWHEWTDQYIDTENPIPLFETDDSQVVQYKNYGKDDRRILKRSERMEERVRSEGRKVIND
jgi:hypothetical protein